MKIAFPTQEDKGLDSQVFGHFGSAPGFVLVDTEDQSVKSLVNAKDQHAHGQCQPLAALGNTPIDALVVGGIGMGALMKLNQAGIKTYRAAQGTVKDNLDLLANNQLPELLPGEACAGHSGGCGH